MPALAFDAGTFTENYELITDHLGIIVSTGDMTNWLSHVILNPDIVIDRGEPPQGGFFRGVFSNGVNSPHKKIVGASAPTPSRTLKFRSEITLSCRGEANPRKPQLTLDKGHLPAEV